METEHPQATPSLADQILVWVGGAVVVIYGTRVIMFEGIPWGAMDVFGLFCVPLVLAMLLTLRLSFYAVARMPTALFLGRRRILDGKAAWLVPPIVALALILLRETGTINFRYTSQHSRFTSTYESETSKATAAPDSGIRLVKATGETWVVAKKLVDRRIAEGAHRWTLQDAPEQGVHVVGEGFVMEAVQQSLSRLSVANYSSSITITVTPPDDIVSGWFVFTSDGTWQVDVAAMIWTPEAASATLHVDLTLEQTIKMYGFCGRRTFVEDVAASVGKAVFSAVQPKLNELHDLLNEQ